MLGALFLLVAPLAAALPPYVVETTVSHDRRDLPIVNAFAERPVENTYIAVFNSTFGTEAIDARISAMSSTIQKRNLNKRGLDGKYLSTEMKSITLGDWRCAAFQGDADMVREFNGADEVAYVEADTWYKTTAAIMQTNAPPGLNRISHARAGEQGYIFDESACEGMTVYVVDTGVRVDHVEFEGRAVMGANFVNNVDTDENGHGSHVAGTIAGATFGVCKKANIVGVKVLGADGAGQNQGILQGMQFVLNDVKSKGIQNKAVMNMSLGGGFSQALNRAIAALLDGGIVPVVAAGNEKVRLLSMQRQLNCGEGKMLTFTTARCSQHVSGVRSPGHHRGSHRCHQRPVRQLLQLWVRRRRQRSRRQGPVRRHRLHGGHQRSQRYQHG